MHTHSFIQTNNLGGSYILLLLKGKFKGKKARGRPRKTWIDTYSMLSGFVGWHLSIASLVTAVQSVLKCVDGGGVNHCFWQSVL